ncbi:TIGR01621 family pseudouridine synthase [Oceanobacter mangrovi]|uniref:TIGR01621 family pseudouridine synthase n=1 Tax=Oceanobacter mangrovi TaxID=2862510 RepID=UPI001C8E0629|nr:TIGR01621 family pseudouridine synthase [Oceanobacter mangrovi]
MNCPSFTTLQETDDWLAIYKPTGMSMHTEHDQPGAVVLASQYFNRPLWPVHRLDKVTSGILLLAKNSECASRFGELFSNQQIRKFYLAQCSSKPSKKQGWIKGDMEKTRNGSWKLLRSCSNPAITRFMSSYDEASGKRLFLLAPKTGKTHQIRVALKSLGSPIDGDGRYKGAAADRTYLHAYGMAFTDGDQDWQILCPPQSESSDPTEAASNGRLWCPLPAEWLSPWDIFGRR